MKLLLTILFGLLLVQSVAGLHLHTEGEDAGNVTTTENSTDTDNVTLNASNDTDIVGNLLGVAENATQDNVTVDDETLNILEKTSSNYKLLKNSGDEEIAAAAKEAKVAFKGVISGINDRLDSATNLSDDATEQDIDAAYAAISSAQTDFDKAYDDFNNKLEELKKQLEDKQAAPAS